MDFSYIPDFWVLALPCVLYLATKLYFSRRFYKLAAELPGPSTWPIVGNAFKDLKPYAQNILYDACKLLDEYDGFVRLWLGDRLMVLISRSEDLETFFSHPAMLDKGSFYAVYTSALGNGLFTANGDDYRRVKKHYILTYTANALRNCVPVFLKRDKILLKKLEELDGKPISDVHPLIFHYAFTSILDIALEYDMDGKPKKYQEVGMQIEYLAHKSYERIWNPLEYFDLTYPYTSNGKQYLKVLKEAHGIARYLIETKRKEMEDMQVNNPAEYEKKKGLFIFRILEDTAIPESELVDHVATIIATGSDTTASTISFCLMMIGSHPEVQQRVYEEAMAVYENLGGRDITADDLKDFVYLEMVVKETMRLFPIGPFFGRRANADIQFSKYLIPKGTDVGFVQIHMNRDPKRYPNPLEFNPERFHPDLWKNKERFAYVPFSAGPRTCIGAKYAMMSIKLTVSAIVRNFRVFSDKKVSNIILSAETTLKPGEGCLIRLEKRNEELI